MNPYPKTEPVNPAYIFRADKLPAGQSKLADDVKPAHTEGAVRTYRTMLYVTSYLLPCIAS